MLEKRSYMAMDLVRHEIQETLLQASKDLDLFLLDRNDLTKVRFALAYMHQVVGSLVIIESHAASVFAKEIEDTIQKVISNDDGREYRQLSCMTLMGDTHSFTGKNNVDYYHHHSEKNLVIAGNMLASKNVITSMVDFFKKQNGDYQSTQFNFSHSIFLLFLKR